MLFRPDGDFAELADNRRVTLIRRVDRHGAVAKHRLRAGGGDRDIVALFARDHVAVLVLLDIGVGFAAGQRVLEVPHVAVDFLVLDFEVGNRGFELRIPVDQPLAAVDQPFLVEADEHLQHGGRQALIHGEALARPVAGSAQPLQLVEDLAAGFILPLPDPLDELLASHLAARHVLAALGELPFDDHLGGDAGMVHPRLPENVVAEHALVADQDVLQRVVERMAHMQRAGHVGRRDHDAIRIGALARTGAGSKGVGFIPCFGNCRFDAGSVKSLVEHLEFRRRYRS